jgi:hypothetical protein
VSCNHQQSPAATWKGCQGAAAEPGCPGHCQHPHPTPRLLPLLLLLLLQLLLGMLFPLVIAALGAAVCVVRVLCRCLLQGQVVPPPAALLRPQSCQGALLLLLLLLLHPACAF